MKGTSWKAARTWGRLAAALLLAGAVVAEVASRGPQIRQILRPGLRGAAYYADQGEALIHGLRTDLHHLPLATVSAAWAERRGEDRGRQAGGAVNAVIAALTCDLALLLAGLPGALAALALGLHIPAVWLRDFDFPQSLYTVLVLLVACLLAWRSRRPSWPRTLALAAAIGVSLLYRSPLLLFAPLLAAWEWLRRSGGFGRGLSPRSRKLQAAALCLLPCVMLLPWVAVNLRLYHRFIPVERDEATCNIVSGALGTVFCVEGDWKRLGEGLPDGRDSWALAGWAGRQVLGHPLTYGRAVLARLGYVFSLHPWLWAAALAAFWLRRRRKESAALALFAGYFTLMHCLLSVKEDYFRPLWPLLAACAGSLTSLVLPSERRNKAAGALALAALLLIFAFSLYPQWLQARLALRPRSLPESEADWSALLAGRDRDAWLLDLRSRRLLAEGRVREAEGALAQALAARPRQDWELRLLWLRALRGDADGLLRLPPIPVDQGPEQEFNACLYRAHILSLRGRAAPARRELQAALDLQDRLFNRTSVPESAAGAADAPRIEAMRSQAAQVIDRIDSLLAARPLKERLPLYRELVLLRPGHAALLARLASALLDQAQAQERGGSHAAALDLLAQAEGLALSPEQRRSLGPATQALADQLHRAALLYQSLAQYPKAVAVLRGLRRAYPKRPDYAVDQGVCEFLSGDEASGIRDFCLALDLDPRFAPARQSLEAARRKRRLAPDAPLCGAARAGR